MTTQATPSIQQLFDLSGRVALITGATGHLGPRWPTHWPKPVAVSSLPVAMKTRQVNAPDSSAASRRAGTLGVTIDHMDANSIERGFTSALEQAGHIDVLVNNGHEHVTSDLTNCTGEEFTRQMANASGYFLLARRVRDQAVARGASANVIMLGSMYGLVGSYPEVYEPEQASPVAYHALKGGHFANDAPPGRLLGARSCPRQRLESRTLSSTDGFAHAGRTPVREIPHAAHGATA